MFRSVGDLSDTFPEPHQGATRKLAGRLPEDASGIGPPAVL